MLNPLQALLIGLVLVFVVLYALRSKRPGWASSWGRWVTLGFCSVVVLAPFFWLLAAVFKDRSVLNEYVFFPPLAEWSTRTLNLDNFRRLFEGKPSVQGTMYFWHYVLNSVAFTTVSTILQLLLASLAGYALAKFRFPGKGLLMVYMLGSMMIPQVLLMAPVYELVVRLGMVDTLWGLMLPGIVSVYGIFLFRQACMTVPNELIEAGRIDGCSEWGIYFRLVMPLVRPMAAAFCLVSFLGNWNAFFAPNVFLHSQDQLTLPVVLNLYINQYEDDYGLFLAGTALAMVPPAILFFALQKEFVAGLTSGAVKG